MGNLELSTRPDSIEYLIDRAYKVYTVRGKVVVYGRSGQNSQFYPLMRS